MRLGIVIPALAGLATLVAMATVSQWGAIKARFPDWSATSDLQTMPKPPERPAPAPAPEIPAPLEPVSTGTLPGQVRTEAGPTGTTDIAKKPRPGGSTTIKKKRKKIQDRR